MLRPTLLFAVSLLVAGCGDSPDGDGSPAITSDEDAAIDSVTGADIRAHMEVLAADDLQGREAGTEYYDRAADYVIDELRAAGIEALGEGGSYLQPIEFLESRLIPESANFSIASADDAVELEFREDFVMSGGFGEPTASVTAPLLFVGHGIVAPELGHDDFEGVDADGKILVMLSGAPPQFDTDRRAYYSSSRGKSALAESLGAVGIVTVRTPIDQARRPWERYLPGIGAPGMRWLDGDGNPYQGFAGLVGGATVSEAGAAKIFDFAERDLDALFERHAAGETGSFELGIEATLAQESIQRRVTSSNVVGVLRGSDPALADEYLIYTGHLDHIGLRPGKDGDDIHNGAYDNAAGIGAILEIAEAMAMLDPAPRRSVIFAFVTAEEKGLQGSSYFAKNPTVPADSLVANINIDMPYLGFPVNDVHAFGAEHSTLEEPAEQATRLLGMSLTPDPKPEEVRFIRSDQFSFVQEGIPAVAFKAGMQSSDPSIDGEAALNDFLQNHYHQASDDLALPYSNEGAERFARAGLVMGLKVANADERPRWLENDFFGDKFAQRQDSGR